MSRSSSSSLRGRYLKLGLSLGVLGSFLASGVFTSPVQAVAPKVVKKGPYSLAPGVELLAIHYPTPNEVRVLTITPSGYDATIDVGSAGTNFGAYKKPSQIGQDAGAIAAVNGDYNQNGGPAHFDAIDSELRTTGILEGTGFAIKKDETAAYASRPTQIVSATTKRSGTVINSFKVDRWNAGDATGAEIAGYTPVGNNTYKAPSGVCSAVLKDPTAPKWSSTSQTAVSRTYAVATQGQPCPSTAPVFGANGKVILTARKANATSAATIKALEPGDNVTITWKASGWTGIVDAVGGQPALVNAGVNVGPPASTGTSYFYKDNPRTGVGITEGCVPGHIGVCKVIIITVDGRRAATWSSGMTLKAFAGEFIKQGAYYAVNLDGGGGTVMWVDPPVATADFAPCITDVGTGCLVNKPSDTAGERTAVSALMVLPGADAGEPLMGSAFAPSTTPATGTGTSSFSLSAADPGSTGGLFDAVAGGSLGPIPADPEFQKILGIYRARMGLAG